jgi:Ca2+-transporting ATPase
LMQHPPRPSRERVITGRMWVGILFVGIVMAGGTLYVLDASLPGGLVDGAGTLRYAQTRAFTTLILFQLFNVFNARSDSASAVHALFTNGWLWAAVSLSIALQCVVLYTPFLQRAFSTQPLSVSDWLFCAVIASSVLWLREGEKLLYRRGVTT